MPHYLFFDVQWTPGMPKFGVLRHFRASRTPGRQLTGTLFTYEILNMIGWHQVCWAALENYIRLYTLLCSVSWSC